MVAEEILRHPIEGISREEVEAHFNLLPERYFNQASEEEIRLHIQMIHRLLAQIQEANSIGSLVPIVDWHNDIDQSLTVVNVVTWDRMGLFYKLAGAFSVAGLNILSTRAISRSDHIAIDTFFVAEPNGGTVEDEGVRRLFEQCVEAALIRNEDILPEIEKQSRKQAAQRRKLPAGRLKSTVPPEVNVYHELSLRRTIIEIQAEDSLGLLYNVGKIITDHGFDITFARISTENGVANDTFYIENAGQEAMIENENLLDLRQAIAAIITPEPRRESA